MQTKQAYPNMTSRMMISEE